MTPLHLISNDKQILNANNLRYSVEINTVLATSIVPDSKMPPHAPFERPHIKI